MSSATRIINGERLVVLGWGRAILMQLAHPLVAAGVATHSTFRTSGLAPLWRLHATVRAMREMSFGTPADAARAAAAINRIHDRVHGHLEHDAGRYPRGTPYSAHDPALLAWVHLTLLESVPLAYDRCVSSLPPATRDAYCRESLAGAALLGLPASLVPTTYADVQAAVAARVGDGTLVVTATARTLAAEILTPPLRRFAWPAARVHRLLTIGLLPPLLRAQYGFEWREADDRALDRWTARLRRFSRIAPAWIRRWPEAR